MPINKTKCFIDDEKVVIQSPVNLAALVQYLTDLYEAFPEYKDHQVITSCTPKTIAKLKYGQN